MKVEFDWLKKNLRFSARVRRELVEPENERISIKRQCELLDLDRSTLYYRERPESQEDALADSAFRTINIRRHRFTVTGG